MVCTVDGLIGAAKKFNMKSVALTDHGVLYGIIEFYKKATKEGIKPILVMEAYVVNAGDRFERKSSQSNGTGKKRKNYSHLILLAKNKEGYRNLTKLSTLGHTEGFYYRPRIDLDIIKKYSEGLVCTSACAVSPEILARRIAWVFDWLHGDVKLVGIRATSRHYLSLYPKNFYDLYIQIKPGLVPPIFDEFTNGFDQIVKVDLAYLERYRDHPFKTDVRYLVQTFTDIVFRGNTKSLIRG